MSAARTRRPFASELPAADGSGRVPQADRSIPSEGGDVEARISLGSMPLFALIAAFGLLLVALGNDAAREGDSTRQALFWIGLAVIYAPIAFRLLSRSPKREERIALALTLGLSLFVVKVLRSPAEFVRFDELGWWRATHDVTASGHAFSDNPFLVTTAGYPGLAMVTAALSQLTGISIFHAGLIVIGTARVTLMLALFLLLERATGSARAAGVAAAVYVCNPSFLYFDAQFGYESLALMIGIAILLAAHRWTSLPSGRSARAGLVGAMAVLCAFLAVTHHMTSLAVLAFLAAWAAVALYLDPGLRRRWLESPALPALLMLLAGGLWFAFAAGALTVEELGGVFSRSFESVADLISGSSGSKHLFSGSGQTESLLARALAVASTIPLLVVVPIGLLKLRRDRERGPLRLTLAAVAVLYPVTLAFRLTQAASETSQRASEFVFVGVAFLVATVVVAWNRGRQPRALALASLALATVATVTFLGGFIIGELQATRQPGSYLVGAEDRSVTPQGVAAADFAARQMTPRSRVLADRTSATLLGSYGGLDPIFGKFDEISVPRVLFSRRFDRADRRVVRGQSLGYVVVDTRLSSGVPVIGYYVESDEPGAFTRARPIGLDSLKKFASVPGVSRIYTNGPISIYDTTALLR